MLLFTVRQTQTPHTDWLTFFYLNSKLILKQKRWSSFGFFFVGREFHALSQNGDRLKIIFAPRLLSLQGIDILFQFQVWKCFSGIIFFARNEKASGKALKNKMFEIMMWSHWAEFFIAQDMSAFDIFYIRSNEKSTKYLLTFFS